MITAQRKEMPFDDGTMSYLEWEADAPVLHFAHATGFNAETYRQLLQPLAGKFHIFAADLRGHGFSTLRAVPEEITNWDIYGTDLARFLSRVTGGPAVLAGHSMGSIASLMVGARNPELVRALVFAEPVLVPAEAQARAAEQPARPNLAEMAARRRQVFASFDDALDRYRGRGAFTTWPEETLIDYLNGGLISTGNGTEVRLACIGAWESRTFQNAPPGGAQLAAGVKCPLTLLHAGADAVDSTARTDEIATVVKLKPDAKIVGVPGTTHFLPMEKPETVRAEILAFA
jgi:pimeloyl-ACP methyl ester carboxylesterase